MKWIVSDAVPGKFAPKPAPAAQPKKAKAASRFDQVAQSVATNTKSTPGRQSAFYSPSRETQDLACTARALNESGQSERNVAKDTVIEPSFNRCAETAHSCFPLPSQPDCFSSAAEFFRDTPWGGVPSERRGQFTVVPVLPRGRLLGGSKLAALAAAKKKRQEDESRATGASQAANAKAEADKAVALLDKLTVKSKDNATPPGGANKENVPKPKNRLQYRKRQPSPEPVAEPKEEPEVEEPTPSIQLPDLRIGPSSFASTLCGDGNSSTVWKSTKAQTFAALTEVHPKIISGDAFAGPSPDDVVLRAQGQAKGKRAVHG